MSVQENAIPSRVADDEIDLRELFAIIWRGKWIIFATTLVFAVASVFYTLSLPNVYKSEVLLSPVIDDGSLKIPGQLGGLAALAGVNLGGAGGGDKTALALEILKSREFIGRFIEQNDLYVPIMAAKGWNRAENQLLIDQETFDTTSQQWLREVKLPFEAKPSAQETFDKFKKLFAVTQDKSSGMVKLSIEHYSPILAKQWVDKLVIAINEEMRQRELAEAERSIAYLNNQIAQTTIADIRTMLFSLIEEQTKTVMLANVRDEYVFKTVDPAIIPELKAKPKRALIVIVTVILAGMLSVFAVLILSLFRKKI